MGWLDWVYLGFFGIATSSAHGGFHTSCSFKLVEHIVEHGECCFGNEVSWQSAELVGEVLDVTERAEEGAGKTRGCVRDSMQDVQAGADVGESRVGHSPIASLACGQLEGTEL